MVEFPSLHDAVATGFSVQRRTGERTDLVQQRDNGVKLQVTVTSRRDSECAAGVPLRGGRISARRVG